MNDSTQRKERLKTATATTVRSFVHLQRRSTRLTDQPAGQPAFYLFFFNWIFYLLLHKQIVV